jgi:ACR3 family arsenite efflux pump ArsB
MSGSNNSTSPLGIFERWLSLWVALAIIGGIILGNLAPDTIDLGDNLPDDGRRRLCEHP